MSFVSPHKLDQENGPIWAVHDSQNERLFEIKIPKDTIYTLFHSALHSEHEYGIHFEIHSAFHLIFEFFSFLQDFYLQFFLFISNCRKFNQESPNLFKMKTKTSH